MREGAGTLPALSGTLVVIFLGRMIAKERALRHEEDKIAAVRPKVLK